MKGDVEGRAARGGATTIVIVVVGLAVAVMFGVLYASTPPTVVMVNGQDPAQQQ